MHDCDTEQCGDLHWQADGVQGQCTCVGRKIMAPDEVGFGDKQAPDMGLNTETRWQRQGELQMVDRTVGVGKIQYL